MTDLEQGLRSELQAAAADYELGLDPDLVLSAGKGARRVRSAHRLVLVAILAAAISLAGVVAAPRIVAQILNKQTVEFADRFEWKGTKAEFDEFSAKLVNEDGVERLTVTGYRDEVQKATVTRELSGTGVVRFAIGSRTIVAVFPGEVSGASIVTGASNGTQRSWASAFDRTIAIGMFFEPVKDLEELDWLWVGGDGRLRHADGVPVPSATIALDGVDHLMYRNDRTDELGLWGRASFSLKDFAETDLLHGGMSRGSEGKAESWQFGVLPAGAHDVQLTLSRAAGSWGTATLSDGTVVVLAIVQGEVDNVLTGFSYTSADGTRVTHGR